MNSYIHETGNLEIKSSYRIPKMAFGCSRTVHQGNFFRCNYKQIYTKVRKLHYA